MLDANEVIRKLKELLGFKTDLELANLLGIKPNTLSSWKIRETVRFDKIIEVCRENHIDLNEVFLVRPNLVYNVDMNNRVVKMVAANRLIEYCIHPEKCLASSPSCVFPTEEEVTVGFQIPMENMYPTIKVSAYVLSMKIEVNEIKPWHLYVLVVENRGILCYRFKRWTTDNRLLFVSDNPAFDNLTLQLNDIQEIFIIRSIFLPNVKGLLE
ncbi:MULTISPECIES: LexA family transcriptional regulator [unclassified Myroides]|uniref:LexA family transcriptional regulator n=1 Tax=unclassified Myroides TaxID=2642485 RepID=UPI003D2F6FDA